MRGSSLLTAAFVIGGVLVPISELSVCADGGCPNRVVSPPSQALDAWVSIFGGQCVNGSYIKAYSPYLVEVRAEAQGSCMHTTYDPFWGPYGGCRDTTVEEAGVVGANMSLSTPTSGPNIVGHWWPVSGYPHVMDSRITGSTQPQDDLYWTPLGEGIKYLRIASTFWATGCAFVPTSLFTDRSFVAVNCLPRFNEAALPNDGQPITVSVPAGLSGVVDAAVQAWHAAGVNIDFIQEPCATSSNHCVEVEVRVPPNNPTACGEARVDLLAADKIYIRPQWVDWTPEFRKATMTHEFGHLLGLEDQPANCSLDILMNNPISCNNMADITSTPQPSDSLPVQESVYGTRTKTTCPEVP